MYGFFDFIGEIFITIWDFITNLINSLITLLVVVSKAVTVPPLLVGMVPGVIGTCIICVAAIGIAKLIVGWGNR